MKQDYAINADYNIGDLSTNHSFLLNGKPIEGKTYIGDETTIHVDDDTNVISVKDGGITSDKLVDGAVTADKIAENAVTADKIAEGAAVANILDGSITRNKLSTDLKFFPLSPSDTHYHLGAIFPIASLQTFDFIYNENSGNEIGFCRAHYILYSDLELELLINGCFTSNENLGAKFNLAKSKDFIKQQISNISDEDAEFCSDMTKFYVAYDSVNKRLIYNPVIHATHDRAALYVNNTLIRNRDAVRFCISL